MKRIWIFAVLAMLIFTACGKLPDQVRQGKAFSPKSNIVQDNLSYQVKEYNFGRVIGQKVVQNGSFYNVRLEVTNIGKTADTVPGDNIFLELQNQKIKPYATLDKIANGADFLKAKVGPNQKITGWLVFPTSKMPSKVKLHVKDSVIEIQ